MKRKYNLALAIYSHVRHNDLVGARFLVIELLDLLNKHIEEENNEVKAKA